MPATTFEVMVSIDDDTLRDNKRWPALSIERQAILASFAASLDHWIAEQRLAQR